MGTPAGSNVVLTPVADPADPRLAPFRRLSDAAFRRRVETSSAFGGGIVVLEGWLALERGLRTRHRLKAVLVDRAKAARALDLLAGGAGTDPVTVFTAPTALIDEVVGFALHRGVVAVADRGRDPLWSSIARRARTSLLVHGVGDAENMGMLIRNAAAFDVGAVLVDPTCTPPLSRRSIRVSVGYALTVPLATVRTAMATRALVDLGIPVYALSPAMVRTVRSRTVPPPRQAVRASTRSFPTCRGGRL
ncbi:MAG: TrmH family RNA methyltransferase [Microthrixaceae bacterium]